MKIVSIIVSAILVLSGCSAEKPSSPPADAPFEVKVVVVNMFEIGADEGDKAGEFQLWKAGQQLDHCVPFPASYHDICLNQQSGVLGIVTGMGTARAASAIMALGLDPRFDLSKAYWLVVGIAGVDPHDASIGSAVWANYLVDGDLAHEVDARDKPQEWQTGYFPLFQQEPLPATPSAKAESGQSFSDSPNGEVYKLNTDLVNWAFELTKDTPLNDYPAMQELRAQYLNYPNARKPPFVLVGDQLAASTFWHGKHLNQWANDWVSYWTQGQGNFVTSGMEDTGSYQAMTYLDNAGKADKSRFMVLRTASNYSMPPDSISALQNLRNEGGETGYAGMQASLDAAYSVGSKVVDSIVANWDSYKHTMPYASAATAIVPVKPETNATKAPADKPSSEQLVAALQLEAHVEGGYFRQTFKADHRPTISTANGERVTMTSIYYLLTAASPKGHFHMNQSDIMHYFHGGDPITYYLIEPDGTLRTVVMGSDPTQGQQMQMVVKGGTWKASEIPTDGKFGYGLIGEAVAPGFEYADMQLGKSAELSAQFPAHAGLIGRLTR